MNSFCRVLQFAILVAVFLLGNISIVIADDSPHWRGICRDGIYRESGLLTAWPADGLTPLWTVEGIGDGYSSASVAKGAIYTTGMTADAHRGLLRHDDGHLRRERSESRLTQ